MTNAKTGRNDSHGQRRPEQAGAINMFRVASAIFYISTGCRND